MASLFTLLAQANENAVNPLIQFAPFIIIGVLFYMMLIRPERRKRSDLQRMLSNLKKNDRVITVGGIYGTVVNAPQGSKDVSLRVDEGNNIRLRVLRSSISQVLSAEEAEETPDS